MPSTMSVEAYYTAGDYPLLLFVVEPAYDRAVIKQYKVLSHA